MRSFLTWLWMRTASALVVGSLSIALVWGFAYAVTYPSSAPSGETAGGKFSGYFTKIGTSCPSGQALQGFTSAFDKVCVSVTATAAPTATPVNGSCSTAAGSCTAGSLSGDNGATSCGTTRTWSCLGSGGGTTASCSKANAACMSYVGTNGCVTPVPGIYKIVNNSSTYVNAWGSAASIYATSIKVASGGASGCAKVLSTGGVNYWYVSGALKSASSVTTSSNTFSTLGAVYGDDYGWRQNLSWIQVQ